MYAVRLSTVLAYSESDDGGDPDDDACGDELQDAEPDALGSRQHLFVV